ncbi:CLC_0170 family protein [Paramaledivibacter caminithermalis]|jgi:cbb3-type cytochrome oxidase subunit 3|uniref:Uncharacterized protein n=1 Tax=Paramaledivibacter caminithermalis (strain DSM 15212 / CIP 107654 / DViRD3) TaxID=1121301 RepID=A0A1M6KH82_PARC5|nr:hypothetical protein SAMN02745912_00395 [Paramaledivibacter caminithermalis DSM 15212]
MSMDIERIKSFFTMYILLIIIGVSLFSIFIDFKALKKKNLKREAKICKFLGYIYLVGGITFFIIIKYVL